MRYWSHIKEIIGIMIDKGKTHGFVTEVLMEVKTKNLHKANIHVTGMT
jgi:hypothetical protein